MARMTQSEKNEAYRKARRNLQQNVRRMEKRGYDVSSINIPEIPVDRKIRQSDINQLKKINTNRYKDVTYETYIWGKDEYGERALERKTYKGERAKTMARRESAQKGVTTRRIKNRIREQYPGASKEEIDWRYKREREQAEERWRREYYGKNDDFGGSIDSIDSEDFPEIKGPSDDAVWDENAREWREPSLTVDTDAYDYFQDRETGEIIELPKGSKNPNPNTYMRTLPQRESGEKMYDNAISQLSIYEEYMGDPKHGRDKKHDETTRENATKIRELLEKLHAENPDALYKALETIGEPLLTTDIKYFKGGYNNMAFQIAQALSYNGYDITPSEYDEGDYDEGNFEY